MLRFTTFVLAVLLAVMALPGWALSQEPVVAARETKATGDALGFVMRGDGLVVGRIATVDPNTFSLIRPSCGKRRSAMFSFAISLMREMIAARN